MVSITREKIDSINRKCWNGWELDLEYFMFHEESTLYKDIQISEDEFLRFRLEYNSQKQISLHISKYFQNDKGKVAVTTGLGKNKVLDETEHKRKSINKLVNLTKGLTNTNLLEINANTEVQKSFGMFQESEDF